MAGTGIHILLDMYSTTKLLDNESALEALLYDTANVADMTVLGKITHKFTPQGVSAILLLAESHISIHTWPEKEFLSMDIYTCKTDIPADKILKYILDRIHPYKETTQIIYR